MFTTYWWCVFCVSYSLCSAAEGPKVLSLWHEFPLKTLINTSMLQPQCQYALKNVLNSANDNDLNALKMLDATAKLPSGLLNGNVVQYGDFTECMEVPDAQYCLGEIDLEPIWKQPYSKYKELVHSFYFFRETFNDPAHRIPGFSMVRWGFCIPRQCSSTDLTKSLHENFGVQAQIRPGMCQKSGGNVKTWTVGDYAARIFFAAVLLAVFVSTLIDYVRPEENVKTKTGDLRSVLMCFSLQRNLPKLIEVRNDDSEIPGLHGIRALNALGLLLSHKGISLFFYPFMNRTSTIDRLSKPWTILGKNAIVYTDSFMLISGLLNANALLNDLNNGRSMNLKDKLLNRIFRILPNLLALILFCTYLLPFLGSGPLWPTIIDHHSVLCKQYMWRNILFVHNYFGFENMCLTHTHQLGIDMQLFLITPIIIYCIWYNRRIGLYILVSLAAASTVLRFWVAYENELASVVYFGIPISKMFAMSSLSYILPTHRATIYLMGVYLAYFLKHSKHDVVTSKIQIASLWGFFLPVFLWSWVGAYHMVQRDYVYNKLEGSLISAFSPILWGAGISFGIYATSKNIAGWLGRFLCWRYFGIVTKLAYALYLVQFPVFFYNVGIAKHVDEYQAYYQLQIVEAAIIILLSCVLVLFIEMPFQNIRRVIFEPRRVKCEYKEVTHKTVRTDFKTG